MKRRNTLAVALSCAIAALLAGAPAAVSTAAADSIDIGVSVPEATHAPADDGSITNAELRWSLNKESSAGAYAGGCNFLSAGLAGDSGSAHVWAESDNLYSAGDGNVSIVKATANGGWEPASFDTKCQDSAGAALNVNSLASWSQSQVVIDGGSGGKTEDGGIRLDWEGSFTVAFYGGMAYWSGSDPQLVLDSDGNGQVVATLSGYGTSMDDMTKWVELPGREVVLAELRGVSIDAEGGFAIIPEYLGVDATASEQVAQTAENATYWGAFPASFLDFQRQTGLLGYWLSTNGQRDAAKPTEILTINYDAEAPAIVPITDGGIDSSTPVNPLTVRPADSAAAPASSAAAVTAPSPLAAAAAAFVGGSSISLMRDDGAGLIPEAVREAFGSLALPVGGAILALLVSALLWLQLTGNLVFPWSKPKM
ncbi:MAG: hypothetical protein JWQ43_1444 [Glaciihabitans sp.]|nr:hypothetical protein [Glaciihabitans sp.]